MDSFAQFSSLPFSAVQHTALSSTADIPRTVSFATILYG
jgi:hypothetical protein